MDTPILVRHELKLEHPALPPDEPEAFDTPFHEVDTPDEAVSRASTGVIGAAFLVIGGTPGHRHLWYGSMTPFGPVARDWPDAKQDFISRFITDTRTSHRGGDIFVCRRSGVPSAAAMTAFFLSRPTPPSRLLDDGTRVGSTWSVSRYYPQDPIRLGDELNLQVHVDTKGHSTIYFVDARDRECGTYQFLERRLVASEVEIVARSRAIVERIALGRAVRIGEDFVSTQILSLRVPFELLNAFTDGRLKPREVRQ